MIKYHKWDCNNCDTKLFLRVDDQDPREVIRLLKFETFVTKHCIEKNHQITHREKEEFKTKYV